jgi:hypothetical protein
MAGEKVDPRDVTDWIALNSIVGDQTRTLEWFDKVKTDARWKPLFRLASAELESLLVVEKRWADIPMVHADPKEEIESFGEMMKLEERMSAREGIPPEQNLEMMETMRRVHRDRLARLYAGLLAADREAEANAFAGQAREVDGDKEAGMLIALLEMALQADEARQVHMEWLTAAAKSTPEKESSIVALQSRIQRGLDTKPAP